ncbi:sodium-coupled monocarboxylate transporter 1-like [Apostichopus japonicus]|uniref:sodium-coupled monocarboxylate transporter 1-like n=1 Tax=Stichopus japonicus TaxID=307972 RepID=UPI003AB32249
MATSTHLLSATDYVVFVFLLMISAFVGLYHAAFKGRQRTSKEYFLANRSMHPLPVAVSLAVSIVSAVTFIGTPALSYVYGPAFWQTIFGRILSAVIVSFVFCPVLYNLKITSIYEYLERRFNRIVRYIAMFIQLLSTLLILGVVVYAPALALNAVTGISLFGSILAVGIISTFYSTIGGIKAVVWNDVIQSSIMVIGFILIIIVGCIKVGGIEEVWSRAIEGNRTFAFDFRPDPTIRLSFWSTSIGGIFLVLTYVGTNQNQAQRFLTCKDLRSAEIATFCGICLVAVLEMLAVLSGIVIYAFYFRCDPLKNGFIAKADQIVPFFAVEVFRSVPGLTGLIVSAVCSASLSTISTAINGIVTVVGEGGIKKLWPQLSDAKFTKIMKMVSVICGLMFMLMAGFASVAGSMVIPLGHGLIGAHGGAVAGVFLLGILIPWGNTNGATAGIITGALIGTWILIGSVIYPPISTPLPLSNDRCPVNDTFIFTTTTMTTLTASDSHSIATNMPFDMEDSRTGITRLYSISFFYFAVVSCLSSLFVGIVISLLFPCKDLVDANLLSPFVVEACQRLPQTLRDKCPIRFTDNDVRETKTVDVALLTTQL